MADKLKIAVLDHVWGEEETPESEKAAESGRKRKEKEDREEIFDALWRGGSTSWWCWRHHRPDLRAAGRALGRAPGP